MGCVQKGEHVNQNARKEPGSGFDFGSGRFAALVTEFKCLNTGLGLGLGHHCGVDAKVAQLALVREPLEQALEFTGHAERSRTLSVEFSVLEAEFGVAVDRFRNVQQSVHVFASAYELQSLLFTDFFGVKVGQVGAFDLGCARQHVAVVDDDEVEVFSLARHRDEGRSQHQPHKQDGAEQGHDQEALFANARGDFALGYEKEWFHAP